MTINPQAEATKGTTNKSWTLFSWGFKSYLFIYLFIYFWLCWEFVAVCRLSLVTVRRGLLSSLWASHCSGSTTAEHRLQDVWASVVVPHELKSCSWRALEHGPSSCVHGFSCPVACGIFLDQGFKLFPELAGGFLTTGPLGKSLFKYSPIKWIKTLRRNGRFHSRRRKNIVRWNWNILLCNKV